MELVTKEHLEKLSHFMGEDIFDQYSHLCNHSFFLGYTKGKFPQHFQLFIDRATEDGVWEMRAFEDPDWELGFDDPLFVVYLDLLTNSEDHTSRFWDVWNENFNPKDEVEL